VERRRWRRRGKEEMQAVWEGREARALGGGCGGEDGVMPWHSRAGGTPVFPVWWLMEETWPGSLPAWGSKTSEEQQERGAIGAAGLLHHGSGVAADGGAHSGRRQWLARWRRIQ
jgi:hypothetical protein